MGCGSSTRVGQSVLDQGWVCDHCQLFKGTFAHVDAHEKDCVNSWFTPSAEFAGRRVGHFFSTGRLGTGYYMDVMQPQLNSGLVEPPSPVGGPLDITAAQLLDPEVSATVSLRVVCLDGSALDVTVPQRGLVREVKLVVAQVCGAADILLICANSQQTPCLCCRRVTWTRAW
jgi:hypothetical protein